LNGIATSTAALGRAAGPAFSGAVFSWGVKSGYIIAPWWLICAFSIVAATPVFWLVEGEGFGQPAVEEDENDDDDDDDDDDDESHDDDDDDDGDDVPSKRNDRVAELAAVDSTAAAAGEADPPVLPGKVIRRVQ
jgi:hypothetical protein